MGLFDGEDKFITEMYTLPKCPDKEILLVSPNMGEDVLLFMMGTTGKDFALYLNEGTPGEDFVPYPTEMSLVG